MIQNIENALRIRVDFSKIKNITSSPNLVSVQTEAYEGFIQRSKEPADRAKIGMEAIFNNVFPIANSNSRFKIEYISYRLAEPRYSREECKNRGATYTIPIWIKLRLITYELAQEHLTANLKIQEVKEDEIFFGNFPLMTPSGYFIVNGTERVIVSQLHRSPGVFFLENKKPVVSRKQVFIAAIIPQRGSWLDFEFDSKDILNVKIDRKKKLLVSTFFQALGYTCPEIIERFYPVGELILSDKKFYKNFDGKIKENTKITQDILDGATYKVIGLKGDRWKAGDVEKFQNIRKKLIEVSKEDFLGAAILKDVISANGETIAKFNEIITLELLEKFLANKVKNINYFLLESDTMDAALRNTILQDKITSIDDAAIEIYKKLKTSIVNLEKSKSFVKSFLFDEQFYSLSKIGRMQFNKKFGKNQSIDKVTLDHDDLFETVARLFLLRKGKMVLDDIDNLKNRRVKDVGELLGQCFNKGMFRIEKNIKEKMVFLGEENTSLNELFNVKLITGVIHDFFATNQLSQFMEQTNPLSEMTHKRRLSALGPGGLSRDRAGFEVRDVHPSHYGRICPIETPEGPSIGLMSSFTIYAKLDEFGFIETPYRKVKDMQLTNEVKYMSALDDSNFYIAQSNALLDKKERFIKEMITLRKNSEFKSQPREWAEWIDLSPHQLVSVAASLIPFLEHDDANRALMGSNMQRQAVPLAIPEAPFVGTGMEALIAQTTGVCVLAEKSGVVRFVDATKIIMENTVSKDNPFDIVIYRMQKYDRTNQNTCINQIPLVAKGDKIQKGQIIANGPACESGELALGKNVKVAFMSWNGFNYEDSLVVSERLLHNNVFTSVHIEKFETSARDTKIGREHITRDVPSSSEYRLRNLDESGIVRIGCYVKTGDILVGKTTPKTESQLNPEEKLLRAIFGDKAADIRDSSLKVPQGVRGIVMDVKVFNRRGVEKKSSTIKIEEEMISNIDKDNQDELFILKSNFINKHKNLLEGEKLKYDIVNTKTQKVVLAKKSLINVDELLKLPIESFIGICVENEVKNKELVALLQKMQKQAETVNSKYRNQIENKRRLEDLPQGVNQIVKVYIAMKRKLSVGDKMSGRHGNKGVVSKILPVEDMPHTEDGEPIDLILNPLGVPSRMNIGQLLETHLGMISKHLGDKIDQMLTTMVSYDEIKKFVKEIYQSNYINQYLDSLDDDGLVVFFNKLRNGVYFATPVFDGAKETDIRRLMDLCGMDYSGKVALYDGQTGEKFKQKVTIGYKYMCKLYHLVDDKLHARSTGPYSLVTQQPLGGKSHFGGQRFGEMEVWALEAYGAAFILKELLTVKSDDIFGRNKVYEAIVKGDLHYESGIPESFKVLVNELRSLCIDLELVGDSRAKAQEIMEDI